MLGSILSLFTGLPKDLTVALNKLRGLPRPFLLPGTKSDIYRILNNQGKSSSAGGSDQVDGSVLPNVNSLVELNQKEMAAEKWNKDRIAVHLQIVAILIYWTMEDIQEWYSIEEQKEKLYRYFLYFKMLQANEKDRKLVDEYARYCEQMQIDAINRIQADTLRRLKDIEDTFKGVVRDIFKVREEKSHIIKQVSRQAAQALAGYEVNGERLFTDTQHAEVFMADYLQDSHMLVWYAANPTQLDNRINELKLQIGWLAAQKSNKAQSLVAGRKSMGPAGRAHLVDSNEEIKKIDRMISKIQEKHSALIYLQTNSIDQVRSQAIEKAACKHNVIRLIGDEHKPIRLKFIQDILQFENMASQQLSPWNEKEDQCQTEAHHLLTKMNEVKADSIFAIRQFGHVESMDIYVEQNMQRATEVGYAHKARTKEVVDKTKRVETAKTAEIKASKTQQAAQDKGVAVVKKEDAVKTANNEELLNTMTQLNKPLDVPEINFADLLAGEDDEQSSDLNPSLKSPRNSN